MLSRASLFKDKIDQEREQYIKYVNCEFSRVVHNWLDMGPKYKHDHSIVIKAPSNVYKLVVKLDNVTGQNIANCVTEATNKGIVVEVINNELHLDDPDALALVSEAEKNLIYDDAGIILDVLKQASDLIDFHHAHADYDDNFYRRILEYLTKLRTRIINIIPD